MGEGRKAPRLTEELVLDLISEVRDLKTAVEKAGKDAAAAKASSDATFRKMDEFVKAVNSFNASVEALRKSVANQIEVQVKRELDKYLPIAALPTNPR